MQQKEEKPVFILKPNVINAIIPLLIKKLLYTILIVGVLLGLIKLLILVQIIHFSFYELSIKIIILAIILLIIQLLFKILALASTNYYFFKTHVIREFKLIFIKRYSLSYAQITNITTDISLWDRLCNAGDLIVHTAENVKEDMKLEYIKNPSKIEHGLYSILNRKKD